MPQATQSLLSLEYCSCAAGMSSQGFARLGPIHPSSINHPAQAQRHLLAGRPFLHHRGLGLPVRRQALRWSWPCYPSCQGYKGRAGSPGFSSLSITAVLSTSVEVTSINPWEMNQ